MFSITLTGQLFCNRLQFQSMITSNYAHFQGNTKILVAVFGPREPKPSQKSKADPEKCYIDVEYSRAAFATPERKRRGRGDKRSQEIRLID